MKMAQILETIRSLSYSQGFYGRIYISLMNMQKLHPEQYDETTRELEAQNFKDAVDLVMYLECD